MPPVSLAAGVATVASHRLQIERGAQVLGGDRLRNTTTVSIIKDTVTRHVCRLAPKSAYSSERTDQAVQFTLVRKALTARRVPI